MNRQADFQLAPSSLTDALYQSLRRRIVNGEIKAGEKLTEHRIAREYDVARPTAKACLERLTVLGLLRRSVHKTAFVPAFDAEEIRDLFFSRSTVEVSAVTVLAAHGLVPDDAAEAQAHIEGAARQDSFEKQVEADIDFHTALVIGVGSPRLRRMHELIMGEVHLTMGRYQAHRTTHGTAIAEEHAAILDAIRATDAPRARERMEDHLDRARGRLLAHLEDDAAQKSGAE